jgi:hypothetical protein
MYTNNQCGFHQHVACESFLATIKKWKTKSYSVQGAETFFLLGKAVDNKETEFFFQICTRNAELISSYLYKGCKISIVEWRPVKEHAGTPTIAITHFEIMK